MVLPLHSYLPLFKAQVQVNFNKLILELLSENWQKDLMPTSGPDQI